MLELIEGDGYSYGYKKLNKCLQEDYGLIINHKKTYRLCKELGILLLSMKIPQKRERKSTTFG
ncbi:MAG: transposase [Thermoanaerobacteraceae bacterium]|nr:transposase [Thermoanaerobacteraceae bacterium]